MQPIGAYLDQHRNLINDALLVRLPVSHLGGAERLNEAVYYAMFPGGKRSRPVIALLAAGVCGASAERAVPAACAIEFLHAASLVFDDLPAMDDASMRRGMEPVHRAFGEDVALLAALALMNQAYGIFAQYPSLMPVAVREIGPAGMIGGQAADVSGTRERSRFEKTSALLRLTMAAGTAAARASASDTAMLIAFGEALGEIYQTCDDMVDSFASAAVAGKTVGQDSRHQRWNVATGIGYECSCDRVREIAADAISRLRGHFGESYHVGLLEDFMRGLVDRGLAGCL